MKIVADENIPLLERFFGDFGSLTALPGREISANDVADADVLLVRSVTKVNASLLDNSNVRFVGSCTAGADHVDLDYLSKQGIRFASAPGANANSVVEYVLSCLSVLVDTHDFQITDATIGIVGYGNIGTELSRKLKKLGADTRVFDPLKDDPEFSSDSLEQVLECDVITLHVPYTEEGEHATRGMIGEKELASLTSSQVLINTSRGGVVDEGALKARLQADDAPIVVLDVWKNEPAIDTELAKHVYLGTPHIAGYSIDGKVAGTEMIYRSLCTFLGLPSRHSVGQFLEEPPLSRLVFTSNADREWCLHTAIRACFDVRHDHGQLMNVLRRAKDEYASGFDRLRKEYRCRREFSGVKIQLKHGDSELFSTFKGLGFNIKP